jgi:hypothetical protein
MVAETAGVRQAKAKSAQQSELLRELGPDAEPDERQGQFRIPVEAAIPLGWVTSGIVPGTRAGRSINFRTIRKTPKDVRFGSETGGNNRI